MKLDLDGAAALVTAAGAGIGLAVARALAAEGARVWAADRDTAALRGLAGVTPLKVDLLAADAGASTVGPVVEAAGRIDILVNCLGGPGGAGGFLDRDDAAWNATLERNLLATLRITRAAIPPMQEHGRGAIVNVASDLARQPDPRFVDYAAAKAALLSVTKSLSIELGPEIRVNAVSPGPTRTPGLVADFGGDEAAIDHYVQVRRAMPAGRLGTPEEVAAVVVFLASGAAAQVTGSEFCVDGGARRQS
ncbi:MAG TPA: SDR family oxidoreductase [Baekduia sp.]|jgi:NAD(P)-dependent dehydrogenase (short-subunit alcohol dehydrogenase family)